jgi:hypothetical protein
LAGPFINSLAFYNGLGKSRVANENEYGKKPTISHHLILLFWRVIFYKFGFTFRGTEPKHSSFVMKGIFDTGGQRHAAGRILLIIHEGKSISFGFGNSRRGVGGIGPWPMTAGKQGGATGNAYSGIDPFHFLAI